MLAPDKILRMKVGAFIALRCFPLAWLSLYLGAHLLAVAIAPAGLAASLVAAAAARFGKSVVPLAVPR